VGSPDRVGSLRSSLRVIASVGIDLIGLLSKGQECFALLASFRVLQRLEVLDLAPLILGHLVVNEEVGNGTLELLAISVGRDRLVGFEHLSLAVLLVDMRVIRLNLEWLLSPARLDRRCGASDHKLG